MGVKKIDAFINNDDRVRVTEMNDIIELQFMSHWNRECPIVKLDKSRYLVKSTGEIGEFNQSMTRKDNLNSLRQSFKRLSYLINANFTGANNELWITMTYKKNMTDNKQASADFDRFLKRFKYFCEQTYGKTRGHMEYVKAIEPQERGAWHFHLLVKFPLMKKVYIPNSLYAAIWGHGIVNVKRPDRTDNIGAYFTSYLTNLEVEEGLTVEEEEEHVSELLQAPGARTVEVTKSDESKRVIKGGRLHLYPRGMQLYNKSKGIKMPLRKDSKWRKAVRKYGLKPQHLALRKSLLIEDVENEFQNVLIIEQYNRNVWKEDSILAKRQFYLERLEKAEKEGAETWYLAFMRYELDQIENKYARLEEIEELQQKNKELVRN
ncbi:hypothetical protein HCJ58_09865 [Listeria sp. FSL L7-1509]|uniref:Replication-associated protein ORF2/G2P domain-containing protein n=3 Tax=Listeria TaxID=1637 RepID=A0ABR6T026_9LIST|nr:hypothetical protein [Listeria immobilis]MBC1507263.1 hypothetical protein [Listeria immobilis]MBC1511270.1 hypothetical protein [Listeria immobilis]MBC6298368.1 hypothetical protein [Listeria immobilis]MBC6304663.1 hypothetical protein [Listeria immobilis]MBC6312729.1 hypothetical protein [Listeria immobilis]